MLSLDKRAVAQLARWGADVCTHKAREVLWAAAADAAGDVRDGERGVLEQVHAQPHARGPQVTDRRGAEAPAEETDEVFGRHVRGLGQVVEADVLAQALTHHVARGGNRGVLGGGGATTRETGGACFVRKERDGGGAEPHRGGGAE